MTSRLSGVLRAIPTRTMVTTLSAATSVGTKAFFGGGIRSYYAPMLPGRSHNPTANVWVYHEPLGSNYCTSTATSGTTGALIRAGGSPSLSANDLWLFAQHLPMYEVSQFFYGASQQQAPFGNGYLCVGGELTRIGTAGTATQQAVDLAAAGITSTGTLYFQCWFRDPAAGGAAFNTSDGLSITFIP